ncbi:MAG: peptide chain release factor N(5)-glutamine methyltransferase [Desulfovibrio sp.]|jgi:release factor glutamine methyltransferase|nr:peptide chain release factor N(5)-glutamine methyltransferase [Desulfovibrio sp.]
MRLRRYVTEAGRRLGAAGVDSPLLCARLLVCHLLEISPLDCIAGVDRALAEEQISLLNQLVLRRINGEPLAYILGQKEFFSRNFHVTPDTLIPRPETELLVETALALLPESRRLFFVDVGSGSGCIGITLVLERRLWRGMLLDISGKALEVAKINARRLEASSKLTYVQADMRRAPLQSCSCDLVVSNPPYIGESETARVMAEVLRFEPHEALFSPLEGAAHLEAAIRLAARALKKNGLALVEHGAEQGARARALFDGAGSFRKAKTFRDLAGLERCTCAVKGYSN